MLWRSNAALCIRSLPSAYDLGLGVVSTSGAVAQRHSVFFGIWLILRLSGVAWSFLPAAVAALVVALLISGGI